MIDIHLIRENKESVSAAIKSRNYPKETLDLIKHIFTKDELWRRTKKEEENLRAEKNKINLEVIAAKKTGKKDIQKIIESSSKVSNKIKGMAAQTEQLESDIKQMLAQLPNIPDKSVPLGKNDAENIEIRKYGKPIKKSKDILEHYTLGEKTGLIDFARGVKLAGHRFVVLRGAIAKLERALINFMLSLQTTHGYEEIIPPHLVNTKTIFSTGHLPKFERDLYKCKEDDLWLVPTAEVPLTSIFSDEILDESALPIKMCAYTPCYRREAGEYGRDIKGLIRQHQFNKVELVKITQPENSFEELETMTRDAEAVLQALDLPYRVVEHCTGDLGFSAAKSYDIEVWVPSQDTYREISSCSNCTDFQSRRANIKYRNKSGKVEYVHTLNGSGLAIGRTVVAILENCQEKNEIIIPKVLQDFMGETSISF